MRKKTKASLIALCGILAALATVILFLSGVLPFATIACPVLSSLVLIPVYVECGNKWGLAWYAVVAILALLFSPVKESGILFVFFGYYPLLKKYLGRLPLPYLWKLIYLNLSVFLAYGLMIFVLKLNEVSEEFAQMQMWLMIPLLLLANVSFFIYDVLISRMIVVYHVRLRPKLKISR